LIGAKNVDFPLKNSWVGERWPIKSDPTYQRWAFLFFVGTYP